MVFFHHRDLLGHAPVHNRAGRQIALHRGVDALEFAFEMPFGLFQTRGQQNLAVA